MQLLITYFICEDRNEKIIYMYSISTYVCTSEGYVFCILEGKFNLIFTANVIQPFHIKSLFPKSYQETLITITLTNLIKVIKRTLYIHTFKHNSNLHTPIQFQLTYVLQYLLFMFNMFGQCRLSLFQHTNNAY
jgi:hypothetical protein